MNPRALVQALDPRWQEILDEVLGSMRLSTSDVARLAPKVEELSRAYNAAQAEGRRTELPLEARIAFSFPRDVPKGAAAVRELVAAGTLTMSQERPLRVLDLGAGLGAMTWGIVRALAAAGAAGRVEAVLVDEDPKVLEAAKSIARAAHSVLGTTPVALHIVTRTESLGATGALIPSAGDRTHDLVVLGQVLSEIDPQADASVRLERQTTLIEHVLELVAPDGSLVIVEPALKNRTRHLHGLRDRILERGSATVFAPCLHSARCPMLPIETEWCHEDLGVDLPEWTVPLARAAGLRWQGLTFSYLVLRKDGRRALPPRPAARGHQVRFRAVSDLLRSKGKAELFICGEDGARRRIRRLDRDAAADKGLPFLDLERGDIVTVDSAAAAGAGEGAPNSAPPGGAPPIDERGRVAAGAHVAIDVGAARN